MRTSLILACASLVLLGCSCMQAPRESLSTMQAPREGLLIMQAPGKSSLLMAVDFRADSSRRAQEMRDLVTSALMQTEGTRLVEREHNGKLREPNVMVFGTISLMEGRAMIATRIVDVETTETLLATRKDVSEDQLDVAAKDIASKIKAAFESGKLDRRTDRSIER